MKLIIDTKTEIYLVFTAIHVLLVKLYTFLTFRFRNCLAEFDKLKIYCCLQTGPLEGDVLVKSVWFCRSNDTIIFDCVPELSGGVYADDFRRRPSYR